MTDIKSSNTQPNQELSQTSAPLESNETEIDRYPLPNRVAAWSVHAFTITGVIWACLAVLALANGKYLHMWGWLAVALVVDGLDGTFARKAQVRKVIPWFDGVALDLIVDYMTWTFIPAIFMYRVLDFGPNEKSDHILSMIVMIVICTSSMFCYCNTGMKSEDNYFVGFPAAWNVVAIYLYLLQSSWVSNLIVVAVLAVLTLAPITFCHPFRVRRWMILNIISVSVWFVCTIQLTIVFPEHNPIVWWAWWISGAWFMIVSLIRTFTGRQHA